MTRKICITLSGAYGIRKDLAQARIMQISCEHCTKLPQGRATKWNQQDWLYRLKTPIRQPTSVQ